MNKNKLFILSMLLFLGLGSGFAQQHRTADFEYSGNLKLGTVVKFNDDQKQGVVFWLNRDHTKGCAVSLKEFYSTDSLSSTRAYDCSWAAGYDSIPGLSPYRIPTETLASDGYYNTSVLHRSADLAGSEKAYPLIERMDTSSYNVSNSGWYIPSEGQLRQLYAALSVIDESKLGGTRFNNMYYWSSDVYVADSLRPDLRNVYRRSWVVQFRNGGLRSTSKVASYAAQVYNRIYDKDYFHKNMCRLVRNFSTENIPSVDLELVVACGSGTVSGGGSYPEGTAVAIAAIPDEGWRFTGWDDGNTDNPRRVVMDESKSFSASFEQIYCHINVQTCNSTWGTVTNVSGDFAYGTVVHSTATANSGYEFVRWSNGSIDKNLSVTVTGDATYTAVFMKKNDPDDPDYETNKRVWVGDILCDNGVTVHPADYEAFHNDPANAGVKAKGIVFYVDDQDGTFQHGYAHSLVDFPWPFGAFNHRVLVGRYSNSIRPALKNSRGQGKVDTDSFIEFYGKATTAARLCRLQGEEWYLPSFNQINYLHAQLPILQQALLTVKNVEKNQNRIVYPWLEVDDCHIWSSTESDGQFAWTLGLNGDERTRNKTIVTNYYVRPVCDF